jgi:hypothetical protein
MMAIFLDPLGRAVWRSLEVKLVTVCSRET